MEKKLTILLVEDDPEECKAFIQYIDPLDDVQLVGVTNNADKALLECRGNLPDAVILDLELHNGGGNGVTFLSEMMKSDLPIKPYVLVVTENTSKNTHASVRQLGADFIMTKSQEGYSVEEVVKFLRLLKTVIQDWKKRGEIASGDPLSPAELLKQRVARVTAELNLLGFSPKMLGRKYLIEAIVLIKGGNERPVREIAAKYNKSNASVERAMQHAINHTWCNANIEDLQNFYTARVDSSRGVPTLSEFIFFYADKLAD
ncbi:MAG: response regulator [Defluviitaleaceae bacterium]|nr:response regulator [Defluviitaleaceae bacterium]